MAVGLDVPHRWADGPSCVRFDVCHFEWEAVDSGLGWVFPRPDRLVAGAAAFWFGDRDPPDMERHERALRHSVAEHFRALQIPLDAAETAWRVRHLRPWNGSDPLRSDDGRVLLVGDAFGLADAVFEHGLWNAMHSGFEAAKCILEHDSTAYEPAIALACLPYPEALHRHAERAVASFAGRAPRGDDRRRARAGEPRMNRESDSRAIAEGVEDGAAAAQFDAFHDRLVARIEREIRLFLPPSLDDIDVRHYIGPPRGSHAPEALSATVSIPLWDLISRKGKAWRPGFVILLTEALGKKSSGYEDLLCVLPELLHSASLIIDDIEDASPIRRGAESIHLRYGVDIALNAANTAYFLPYRIIAGHEGLTPQQRLRLYEVVNQTFLRAHIGQAMDIHQGKNVTRTDLEQMIDGHGIDRLLQMHALKTGAFSEGLAAMAAIIAGVDETTHLACSVFGREFGVAFQILDDVRNFSDSPRWTKVCGEDLTGGKPTYAVVRALERLHGRERDRLVEILCSPALRNAPDVLREGIDLVRGSGAIEACHHEAQAIFSRAWADLAPKLMEGRPQVLLHTFFVKVLDLLSDP
jgi:geranylgeranyl diphosphate synthase type I